MSSHSSFLPLSHLKERTTCSILSLVLVLQVEGTQVLNSVLGSQVFLLLLKITLAPKTFIFVPPEWVIAFEVCFGFRSVVTTCLWANYLTLLSLNFLIC